MRRIDVETLTAESAAAITKKSGYVEIMSLADAVVAKEREISSSQYKNIVSASCQVSDLPAF